MSAKTKGGVTPAPRQTYQVRDIPLSLWSRVRAKAVIEGVTVKDVILRLLEEYVDA